VDNQSGPKAADVEGTFHLKDGMLIDTVLKHSNANAVLPMITRSRVLRIDSREKVCALGAESGNSWANE